MRTLLYVTELPSINKGLAEATRKERKAQAEYRAAQAAAPPQPLGPPEEAPPQPSADAPPQAPLSEPTDGPASAIPPYTPSPRRDGVLYPDEVKNSDGTTDLREPGNGLAAPPRRGESGWTGSVQDRADREASERDKNGTRPNEKPEPEDEPKKKQELGVVTKALLGSIGYRVLGQVSDAMDSTERQRSEPQGYTGAGTN